MAVLSCAESHLDPPLKTRHVLMSAVFNWVMVTFLFFTFFVVFVTYSFIPFAKISGGGEWGVGGGEVGEGIPISVALL